MKQSKPTRERLYEQWRILNFQNWPSEIVKKLGEPPSGASCIGSEYSESYPKNRLWPLIKWAFISYITDIYSTVAGRHFKGKICFLDATAGPGISEIVVGDKSHYFFTSPLIPLLTPTMGITRVITQPKRKQPRPFYKIFLYDLDTDVVRYLKGAVREVANKLTSMGFAPCTGGTSWESCIVVSKEDANRVVREMLDNKSDNEKECLHWLVVLDPCGMEIDWSTIVKVVTSGKADLIFNYMHAAIRRQIPDACSKRNHRADKFFPERWRDVVCNSGDRVGEKAYEFYKGELTRLDQSKEVIDVIIRGDERGMWQYRLLYVTKKSKEGERSFIEGVRRAKELIEGLNYNALASLVKSYLGIVVPLDIHTNSGLLG